MVSLGIDGFFADFKKDAFPKNWDLDRDLERDLVGFTAGLQWELPYGKLT